jgi:hypothetical protein
VIDGGLFARMSSAPIVPPAIHRNTQRMVMIAA